MNGGQKLTAWEHKSFEKLAQYRLQLWGGEDLALHTSAQATVRLAGRTHEFYQIGPWLIESRRAKDKFVLFLSAPLPATKLILIATGGVSARVDVIGEAGETEHFQALEGIRGLGLNPALGIITYIPMESTAEGYRLPEAEPAQVPETGAGKESEQSREIQQAAPLPDDAKEQISAAEKARDEAVRALSQSNALLKAEQQLNKRLQSLLNAKADQLLAELEAEQDALNDQLQEQAGKVRAAETELETLRRREQESWEHLAGLEQKRSQLEEELKKAQNLEEIRHLDCQQAQKELDALRIQLRDDENAAALMGTEPLLKGQSLQTYMEEARRALERAENRLSASIALRERINSAVWSAINKGNGTLPLEQELGGKPDGHCGRPESGNQ